MWDIKDILTISIFFLTFNPVCIGLIVSFAYSYIETLKSNLYEAIVNISDKNEKLEQIRIRKDKVLQYCELTDRIIFYAGLYWLVCFAIGILQFALLFDIMKDLIFAFYLIILIFAIVIQAYIIILKVIKYRKSKRSKKNKTFYQYSLGMWWEVFTWLIPFGLNIAILILCFLLFNNSKNNIQTYTKQENIVSIYLYESDNIHLSDSVKVKIDSNHTSNFDFEKEHLLKHIPIFLFFLLTERRTR